jgi:adenylate cyclase
VETDVEARPTDFAVEEKRTWRAPIAVAWALLADSHRRNRMMGMKPPRYAYEREVHDDPRTRTRVGRAFMKQLGIELRWVEEGEAVEGRFLRGDRRFLDGPIARVGFFFAVEDAGGETAVRARLMTEVAGDAPALLGPAMNQHFGVILSRYLDAMGPLAERLGTLVGEADADEPPSSLARRLLFAVREGPETAARLTPADEAELSRRAQRLAGMAVEKELGERIVELLRSRPDDDVRQMRPFELARALGVERRALLRAFLYAARAGLVDLTWQVNCPTCRVATEVQRSLEGLRGRTHCAECDVDFETDFADNVEAVFDVNPGVRRVEPQVYCAASPWFRPHLWAQLQAPARGVREVVGALPPGAILVRASGCDTRARTVYDISDGPPRALDVIVTSDLVRVHAEPRAGGAQPGAPTVIRVVNDTDHAVTVTLERHGFAADMVLGSSIVTSPEFRDLFATEAPAQGVDVSISSLTVLFTDLTGTTALYERLGDARAFAVVGNHFQDVARIVERAGGAIIKTMGDAVMAAFTQPQQAVEAALDLATAPPVSEAPELEIKIGLHEGPCLMVRANDRVDFFGRVVNLASRLQAQAHPREVVILADLLDHPEVERIVRERGCSVEERRVELKGMAGARLLVALRS